MNTTRLAGGYMLIQVLIGIIIITTLSTIVAVSVGSFRERQALSNTVDEVTALLNEARSRTLRAERGSVYGVHLDTGEAVLFVGPTYSSGAAGNKAFTLDPNVELSSITLQGSATDVVFDMLTGDTSQYGTLVVKRVSTTNGQKTLTIQKTGIVSAN